MSTDSPNPIPDVPDAETANVQQSAVDRLQQSLQALFTELVASDAHEGGEVQQTSYFDRMRAHMLILREQYHALAPEERAVIEPGLFNNLTRYFLKQEAVPAGKGRFTLKDLHQAIVRDFANPGFHERLMHWIQVTPVMRDSVSPEEERLGKLAEEFEAVADRRRGFHMINEGSADQGRERVQRANDNFWRLHAYWKAQGDLTCLGRVEYELGEIALQSKNFPESARIQAMSAQTCVEAGDPVGAQIARIKECDALLHVDPANASALVPLLESRLGTLRTFSKESPTAAQWLGNAHAHLAESQEAAGRLREALASWEAVAADPEVNQAGALRQLKDRAPKEAERLRNLLAEEAAKRG